MNELKNKWVNARPIYIGSKWHRAVKGDRREIATYCGETIRLSSQSEVRESEPSDACMRCAIRVTRA